MRRQAAYEGKNEIDLDLVITTLRAALASSSRSAAFSRLMVIRSEQ